jgi:hypothetical protein
MRERLWLLPTVLNLLKLILLLAAGFLYFTGQGWLLVEFLFRRDLITNRQNSSLLHKIPLAITFGFIVNYGVSLAVQSLPLILIIGVVISMLGILFLGRQYVRVGSGLEIHRESTASWIFATFIWMLFLSLILFEPLTAFDARAIWFFHAKMIYFAGSFGASAGWQDPAVNFSHVFYPNLIPGMAAQVAYLLGYWNEYIPKISLAYVLLPATLWLFTFARKSFAFLILILLFPFSLYTWIWYGYMDGYLALYFSIAMLLLSRYAMNNETIDLVSGLTCLVLLLYVKTEGVLAVIAGLVSILTIVFLIKEKGWMNLRNAVFNWRALVATGIVLFPFLAWSILKRILGLTSYFQIGNAQSLERMIARINDHSLNLIAENTYLCMEGALLLLGLLYAVTIARKQPLPKMMWPALISAVIFYFGLVAIYMLTPFDVAWQLSTSAGRTMLSVNGCIFVSCYFLLDSLESTMQSSGSAT